MSAAPRSNGNRTLQANVDSVFGLPVIAANRDAIAHSHAEIAFLVAESSDASKTQCNVFRETCNQLTLSDFQRSVDLAAVFTMIECETRADAGHPRDVAEVLDAGVVPIVFSPSSSYTLGVWKSFVEHFDRPGLVFLAPGVRHADTGGSNRTADLLTATEIGYHPARCVLLGSSGWSSDRFYMDQLRTRGVRTISLEQIWSEMRSSAGPCAAALNHRESDAVIVSIDGSVFEPRNDDGRDARPGLTGLTGYAISSRDVFQVFQSLDRLPVRAVEICLSHCRNPRAIARSSMPLILEIIRQIAIREGKCRRSQPNAGYRGRRVPVRD